MPVRRATWRFETEAGVYWQMGEDVLRWVFAAGMLLLTWGLLVVAYDQRAVGWTVVVMVCGAGVGVA